MIAAKRDVALERLLKSRKHFSQSVMVSVAVSKRGKTQLVFVDPGAKINSTYYCDHVLGGNGLLRDIRHLSANHFIFQQDGAPAHTARATQDWIEQHCPEFIEKDNGPPNSPDLNPLDYYIWGSILERYQAHTPKPQSKRELIVVLQSIWDELP